MTPFWELLELADIAPARNDMELKWYFSVIRKHNKPLYEILMPDLIKKISTSLLIISLAWLPVQVSLAMSFTGSNIDKPDAVSRMSVRTAVVYQLKTLSAEKSTGHCAMHNKLKNCCADESDCGQMEHDCTSHCLNFAAVTLEYSQIIIPERYRTKNSHASILSGITNVPGYRPPR